MKFVVKILDRIGLIFETFSEFFVIFFIKTEFVLKKKVFLIMAVMKLNGIRFE